MCMCAVITEWGMALVSTHTLHHCRKLTDRQKELLTEYAKTEQLENGTVDGVDQG